MDVVKSFFDVILLFHCAELAKSEMFAITFDIRANVEEVHLLKCLDFAFAAMRLWSGRHDTVLVFFEIKGHLASGNDEAFVFWACHNQIITCLLHETLMIFANLCILTLQLLDAVMFFAAVWLVRKLTVLTDDDEIAADFFVLFNITKLDHSAAAERTLVFSMDALLQMSHGCFILKTLLVFFLRFRPA